MIGYFDGRYDAFLGASSTRMTARDSARSGDPYVGLCLQKRWASNTDCTTAMHFLIALALVIGLAVQTAAGEAMGYASLTALAMTSVGHF